MMSVVLMALLVWVVLSVPVCLVLGMLMRPHPAPRAVTAPARREQPATTSS